MICLPWMPNAKRIPIVKKQNNTKKLDRAEVEKLYKKIIELDRTIVTIMAISLAHAICWALCSIP